MRSYCSTSNGRARGSSSQEARTLNAVGIGRIKGLVEATDEEGGGKNIEVSFNDVLLVPNLGRNLLSVAKIVDRGGEVTFNSHGAFVGVKGMRLPLKKASGSSRELYELEFRLSKSQQHVMVDKPATVVVESRSKKDYKAALLRESERHHQDRATSKESTGRGAPIDENVVRHGAWHGESHGSRKWSTKKVKKSYGREWTKMRSKGKYVQAKPHSVERLSDPVGESRRGRKNKIKPGIAEKKDGHQQPDGDLKHMELWSVVNGYQGKRLRWSRLESGCHKEQQPFGASAE